MKITNKNKTKILFATVILLTATIVYQFYNPIIIKKREQVPIKVQVPVQVPIRVPVETEYRDPPIKQYKPGHVQQMGILTGTDEETLPLSCAKR